MNKNSVKNALSRPFPAFLCFEYVLWSHNLQLSAMETHLGAVGAYIGAMKSFSGVIEVQPGAMAAYLGEMWLV
jgi:hypothetical protein